MPVVNSHGSCAIDFVGCSYRLLFGGCRILIVDEALRDPLLLELLDPLSSVSFPPAGSLCWLFLSFVMSFSLKFLSPSHCCDKVSCLVPDLVVSIALIEV